MVNSARVGGAGLFGFALLCCTIAAVPASDKPMPLDILVVAPHPDDEAIGCTGVMLQAIEQKQRVGIVLVTNGDAFDGVTAVAKKPKDQVVPADYVKLAALRQRHTVRAMGRLGVRESDLMFLGYPDGGLEKLYRMEGNDPLQSKFTEKKATYGVEVRYQPGGSRTSRAQPIWPLVADQQARRTFPL